MDISIYFSPISHSQEDFYKEQLGGNVRCYSENDEFPDWELADIIFLGVKEERGSINNSGCGLGADRIREKLFKLFFDSAPNIIDLGNILPGETLNDTYYAVQSCLDTLIKSGKTVVILGGSQDLTIPIYKGYEKTEQLVNLTTIDHAFDIGEATDGPVNSETYLSQILLHQPSFLFNYATVSYTHLTLPTTPYV